MADILDDANMMLDQFQIDRLLVYTYPQTLFTLVGGQQTYLIGPGQSSPNFDAPRPDFIEVANILLTNVTPPVRTPLAVINVDRRADIPVDLIPFALPLTLYYDKGFNPTAVTPGYGTIFLWPGPLVNYTLEVFCNQVPLQQFADVVTSYNFPPAYAHMLTMKLAVHIAPMMRIYAKLPYQEYDKNLARLIVEADDAYLAIQQYNAPDSEVACDPAFLGNNNARGAFNYMIGQNSTGRIR
jgi:hypothetical protein